MNEKKICAVIVAAGSSTRMGGTVSKVLLPLLGEPVLLRTLRAFDAADCVSEIVVAARPEDFPTVSALAKQIKKPVRLSPGGETRQDSVAAAVRLCPDAAYLAIHDGARPFVTPEKIRAVCADAETYGGAALAVRVKDTVKVAGPDGFISSTPDRDTLWNVQTPQVFRADAYFAALEAAERAGKNYTDDCQLFESAGMRVYLTPGDYRNIKLTTPEDLVIGEAFAKLETEETK